MTYRYQKSATEKRNSPLPKKFSKKNLTKNATKGIINSCLSVKNAKLHGFCQFSHKFYTKRKFFLEENLDIISLMLYNIIHKRFKVLENTLTPELSYKISHERKGTETVYVSRSEFYSQPEQQSRAIRTSMA